MRVTLIHNPRAGKHGKDKDDGEDLVRQLREAGHEVRYQSSKADGWKRALKKDADLVVVAGGDGTVGRVTRRMVGRGVPLGLLPTGTANNIARTLGLVERPFDELIAAWGNGRRVKLDVGVAKGPWGERYFIEGVGAGAFASLLSKSQGRMKVEEALEELKRHAEKCEPIELAVELDGEDISGHYLLLEAVNLRYVGPNLHLAPDSTPGDGHFDVVLVTEEERERLVHYLEHWQDNRERLAVLPSRRGAKLKIEWTGFELHVDDKLKPKEDAKPEEMSGVVQAHVDGKSTVEFVVPA